MKASKLAIYLDDEDKGFWDFDESGPLDLSHLAELGPLWAVSAPHAKVTSLPAGYDWSTVTSVGIRWHGCWAPVLQQQQVGDIWISHATQQALSQLDRKLTHERYEGGAHLERPSLSADDAWFMPRFEAERVTIDTCAVADFASAGPFTSIGHLSFSDVAAVRNLAQLSRQGHLEVLFLQDTKVLDPETFWDIQATRVVVHGINHANVQWFYDIWPDRPDNWFERFRITGCLADDLYPQGNIEDPFEGYNYHPDLDEEEPWFGALEFDVEPMPRTSITEPRFWQIIDQAHESCDGGAEEFAEALREGLRQSDQQEVVAFDQLYALKTQALYSWELWGVAYLLLGGCSDDEFTDLRTWIVAQGRDFYLSCRKDPTMLANGQLKDPTEVMDAEEVRYVPDEIFMEMTGTSIEEQYPDQPSASMAGQAPAGVPWDDYPDRLEARFPQVQAL
ncbi:DUF4240 domain-containing protein [Paeniglutamicibacter sp. ABSL32-1]|uniref:DUF4240 domain-containing protein n=1 Tax=Paeniglutamicibacter quisquiliarum TaxID=2849498 RepID=UPI001C2D8A75|nr:DUF4240 domain-containing protein [Paeniglutamicibacter quisquiliarum]MBV1778518.1 DUF4240 domain-containing protein [Paeniglutamicibacter quisquiliarum]